MTLDAVIMLTGAFVAVLPFLGFPHSWDDVLFFLAGALVIALGIIVRRSGSAEAEVPHEKNGGTFVENVPAMPAYTGEADAPRAAGGHEET